MRHVIADPVGAPAERQLRQIAGADDQPAIVVGEPEQVVGAQPGLHILERHVVERLALRRRVADIGEHLVGRRADVDLGAGDAERAHQPPGIGLRAAAGGKAGQRVGQDVGARQAERIHRARRDDQRLRRIEPARDADHQPLEPGRLQPLRQPLHLDVVGLVAIVAQHRRVGRHEREALDPAARSSRPAGGAKSNSMRRNGGVAWPISRALSPNVFVRMRSWRMRPISTSATAISGPALKRGVSAQRLADLENAGLAVPGEVGRRIRRPRPPNRHRPRCSAPIATRTRAAASAPCRSRCCWPTGSAGSPRRRRPRRRWAAAAPRGPRRSRCGT